MFSLLGTIVLLSPVAKYESFIFYFFYLFILLFLLSHGIYFNITVDTLSKN